MYIERGLNKLSSDLEMDAIYLNAKSEQKHYWEYQIKLLKLDEAILKCSEHVEKDLVDA